MVEYKNRSVIVKGSLIRVDLQMMAEVESWPYSFVASEDYPKSEERGMARGRLLVCDRY